MLEKVVSVRTIDFFDKNNLFSPYQFGFRSKLSTEYAVIDIYEKLLKNLDDGQHSCAIFLDLAKAFDSVSHNILLKKLEKYGIRGNALMFFASYLQSRKQFVKLNNVISDCALIEFGVPQGSILGPLLFLIFINDLPSASNFFIRLFADDTFLCAKNSSISLLNSQTNTELKKVYDWLLSNRLTLNISKSKFMIISKKKRDGNFSVQINGLELEECESYKYLGIYIDKNLSWKAHVEHVGKKLSRACGALAKMLHYDSVDVLKNIYYALINSYVRYGLIVWGNTSFENLQPLRVLTNRAVRIMSFAPFGRLDIQPIYKHFNILDVDNTFLLESVKFIYKLKNSLIPSDISIASHFIRNTNSINNYSLRSRTCTTTVPHNLLSVYAQKSIQNRMSILWNNIPMEVIESGSFNSFKAQYKKHLLLLIE